MALKVWCVSYYIGLGFADSSILFISEREAKIDAENLIARGYKDVKCYQVTDIWEYTARFFSEKISNIIESRTNEDGSVMVHNDNGFIEDEIKEVAANAGLEDFSCDVWTVFETSSYDVYALSCAWTYRGELHHYTDTLEVF